MPYTYTAQDYVVEGWRVRAGPSGQIESFLIMVNIRSIDGDGNDVFHSREFELWAIAPQNRRDDVQILADLIKDYLDGEILA